MNAGEYDELEMRAIVGQLELELSNVVLRWQEIWKKDLGPVGKFLMDVYTKKFQRIRKRLLEAKTVLDAHQYREIIETDQSRASRGTYEWLKAYTSPNEPSQPTCTEDGRERIQA